MERENVMRFDTEAVHAGEGSDPTTGAVDTPIYQASTFTHGDAAESARVVEALHAGERDGYLYTRWGNPTLRALEGKLAALEGGEAALATATGMAAISTAILSVARAGDHIVAARQLYSGTYRLLSKHLPGLGIQTTFVDPTDLKHFERALQSNTKLIYMETPSNPLLEITDIAGVAKLGRSAGILTLIDNTFATPFNQRPLELGIDVVLHSTTKYLSGHGDAMGGAVIGRREFIDHALTDLHRELGGVISPFNAWLTLRGTRTLGLRMERHNQNALKLAKFLLAHSRVERVYYPGLEGHPGHELAQRQMRGFGGMLSFEVKEGYEAGVRTINRVKLCVRAVSLGDTRTLITHPASTTHYIVPKEARLAAGISDGLIRLSVGIEDSEDLMEDLQQALN
ncbi:MAG: methionine gamma-lyase, partial [Candidatus Fraserbacteria bacterium RBG_16_55_9]